MITLCDECGLPMPECNAWAAAREAAKQSLKRDGYGIRCIELSKLLVPDVRKSLAALSTPSQEHRE